MTLQRIAIVGSPGSGKSTLARVLGARTGLPVIHMDALYWTPGWVEREGADFRARLTAAAAGDRWIIDGNYSGTMAIRLARADTVVVLDRSRWLCLWRVVKRWLATRGRTRPDMAEGCPEKIDWPFVKFVLDYPTAGALRRDEALAAYGGHAQVVRLRSDAEVRRFGAGWPECLQAPGQGGTTG